MHVCAKLQCPLLLKYLKQLISQSFKVNKTRPSSRFLGSFGLYPQEKKLKQFPEINENKSE